MNKKAVILLSGGPDSATTLAIAKEMGFDVYALTIDYGQRNKIEIEYAKKVARFLDIVEHRIIAIGMNQWGGSALTDYQLAVPHQHLTTEIPITYVPARNTIFLSLATSWAEVLGAYDIFYGANIIDYSNYPDCRPEYISAFEKVVNYGTKAGREGKQFKIHAPLIQMNKAEIFQKGKELGVDFSLTLSCYDPDIEGNSCGLCAPCIIVRKGKKDLKQQTQSC